MNILDRLMLSSCITCRDAHTEVVKLRAERDALARALHEIAEEWCGAECGEPVHAQEAYAIALAKRMYTIAAEGENAARLKAEAEHPKEGSAEARVEAELKARPPAWKLTGEDAVRAGLWCRELIMELKMLRRVMRRNRGSHEHS